MSQELKAIIESEIDNALGYLETETTIQREDALRAYLRQPYGTEIEGKSQIVTGEVAEAVDGALPSLVRIFTGSDEVVRFDPRGPQDEQAAKQATDYCNWVLQRDNDGTLILHDWFKDALLQKVGVVKAYWDESEDITREKYQNLTEDELAMLMADESMEIVEQDTQTFPIIGPDGLQPIGPDGMPATYSIYAVTVQKKSKTGKVVIENIPPEEFLSRNAPGTFKTLLLSHIAD